MGIKDFYKHLKTKYPECFKVVYFSELKYKKIAIDMMNLLYIFKARNSFDWVKLIVQFFIKLRKNFIHPICIFDGKSHSLKYATVEKRKHERDKYKNRILQLQVSLENYKISGEIDNYLSEFILNRDQYKSILTQKPNIQALEEYISKQLKNYTLGFTKNEVESLIQVLNHMGLCTMIAEHDGEALCALLSKNGKVDYVMSNDSDVFFFGSNNAIINFTDTGGYLIHLKDILEKLELNTDLFTDLCLLCGTDFNEPIKGIGFCKSLQLIKNHGSIFEDNFPLKDKLDYKLLKQIKDLKNDICIKEISYSKTNISSELEKILFTYQIDLPIDSFKWTSSIIIED